VWRLHVTARYGYPRHEAGQVKWMLRACWLGELVSEKAPVCRWRISCVLTAARMQRDATGTMLRCVKGLEAALKGSVTEPHAQLRNRPLAAFGKLAFCGWHCAKTGGFESKLGRLTGWQTAGHFKQIPWPHRPFRKDLPDWLV
jgi:hypothetical protein